MVVGLSFPNQTAAEAGILAQELRSAMVREGAPERAVAIVKDDPTTMDAGSVVQVAMSALGLGGTILEGVTPLFALVHCATIIYEICTPKRAGITLTLPSGEKYSLRPEEIDVERLKTIFLSAIKPNEHQS